MKNLTKREEEIMKPEFSEKAESFGGGIFAILNERKEELQKEEPKVEDPFLDDIDVIIEEAQKKD